jgi:hypothetical protein
VSAPPENTKPPAGAAQGFCNDLIEADENGADVKRLEADTAFADGLPGPVVDFDWSRLDPAVVGDSPIKPSLGDRQETVVAVLFAVFREDCISLAAADRAFVRWLCFCWLTAPTIFRSCSMNELARMTNRNPSTICRIVNELALALNLPIPAAKTDAQCLAMAKGRSRAASHVFPAKSPAAIAA